jgi:hypothetical protein
MNEPKRTWTPEEIVAALERSDAFVCHAVCALYERQTRDEQAIGETVVHNKVGFSGCDAEILSSFAKFCKKTGFLTPKQTALARKKLPKYRKQLAAIAAEKNGQKAPAPVEEREPESAVRDEWAEEMKWKALEAKAEAKQEAAAFLSDPDYRDYCNSEDGCDSGMIEAQEQRE